jgi:hypothetical protein
VPDDGPSRAPTLYLRRVQPAIPSRQSLVPRRDTRNVAVPGFVDDILRAVCGRAKRTRGMTRQDTSMNFENRASQQRQWPSQFRAIPTIGDVLASRPTARADTYDISIVPAAAHVTARRYPEAMEKVRELACASGVDGWFTSDHTHYTRVATHRS